jgi:hypothetical protein
MEHNEKNKLRQDNESLRTQLGRIDRLSAENQRLSNLWAKANSFPASASTNEQFREVLKLRGEVGQLKTAVNTPQPSPLSGVIADPEVRKMMRDQQKMGMTMIYKDFTNHVSLAPEQMQKFVDLLADDVMENVDHVTAVLRDGKSREEMDRLFTEQEAALQEKVKALLGPEAFPEYQDYTRNLASHLTAEQFKAQLIGDKAAKEEKSKQLYQVMREETQAALAGAGLGADFQTLPILNFRNIASEQEAEKNLKFMENVFERSAARAAAFLSPEEITKFNEFRTQALQGNRTALVMNRKMMAPGSK